MNENIKEIIAERIKYHSNKQKYGCFMDNDCIDICAADILEDVKKAGYRKQSETVKEFAEKLTKRLTKEVKDNPEAAASQYKAGLYFAMDLAEQYGKEEQNGTMEF